jgi:hypothetical protein
VAVFSEGRIVQAAAATGSGDGETDERSRRWTREQGQKRHFCRDDDKNKTRQDPTYKTNKLSREEKKGKESEREREMDDGSS